MATWLVCRASGDQRVNPPPLHCAPSRSATRRGLDAAGCGCAPVPWRDDGNPRGDPRRHRAPRWRKRIRNAAGSRACRERPTCCPNARRERLPGSCQRQRGASPQDRTRRLATAPGQRRMPLAHRAPRATDAARAPANPCRSPPPPHAAAAANGMHAPAAGRGPRRPAAPACSLPADLRAENCGQQRTGKVKRILPAFRACGGNPKSTPLGTPLRGAARAGE